MCQHTTLVKSSDGFVLWCNECLVYRVHFGSIAMVLDPTGLELFKSNLATCYHENCLRQDKRTSKHLFFNTLVEGLQLWFSTQEVGSLLALLQETIISHSELRYNQS